MVKDYNPIIPDNDDAAGNWAGNFEEKIVVIGPQVGFTPAEVTQAQAWAATFANAMTRCTIKKMEQQEAIALKKVVRKREGKELITLALRIKRSPLYTENMGKELGIVSTQSSAARNTVKPTLKLTVMPGYISVAFNKKRHKGVTIFSRLKGTNGWETLVSGATVSPFEDTRPLQAAPTPEIREYIARYWDNATEIGQESDIVFTLFGG